MISVHYSIRISLEYDDNVITEHIDLYELEKFDAQNFARYNRRLEIISPSVTKI